MPPQVALRHGVSTIKPNFAGRLSLAVRREEYSPELRRVPVPDAFLRDIEHEIWLEHALRLGMPDATLDEMSIEMTPVDSDKDTGSTCQALRFDVVNPRGETFRHDYNVLLFSDAAGQIAEQLIENRVLKPLDNYYYDLVIEKRDDVPPHTDVTGISFGSGPKQERLQYLTLPLKHLLARARPVNDPSDEFFPVIYTAEAYQRAEQFSRRGVHTQPPCESGAALIGTACSCPDSGEFFVVVTDALEATDAAEKKVSLSYTGKTWLRLQAVLKSIQAQRTTRTHRILGQAHGHNFWPGTTCDQCAKVKECKRTSVFVSVDDRIWMQAVFSGAPYALCHIFGNNAQQSKVHQLYSLRENRLTQRGFYVIHNFEPPDES